MIYKISYEWWEAKVRIEDTAETEELMKEQLLFWTGGEDRIEECDGNITEAYLKMLGQELICISITAINPKRHFETAEGWCVMDGSYGIEILASGVWTFEEQEFSIEKA